MNDSLGGIIIGGLLGNPILSISGWGFNITFVDVPTPTPTVTVTVTPPTPTPTNPNHNIGSGRSGLRADREEEDKNSYISINITVNKLNYKKSYIVNKNKISLLIKSISKMKKIKSNINILLQKHKGK